MGSKEEPQENDAYEKALPDEPLFTLLARDILAPYFVRMYASARARDISRMKDIFANLCVEVDKQPYHPQKTPKHVIDARECANNMYIWRINQIGDGRSALGYRGHRAELDEVAAPATATPATDAEPT